MLGWERKAIIEFHGRYPLEGYRRLTFMMLDTTDVAVSPTTTYRVLRQANLLSRSVRTNTGTSTSRT